MTKPQQRISEARDAMPIWGECSSQDVNVWYDEAYTTIQFALALADKVLSGDYVVVPRDATEGMCRTGEDCDGSSREGEYLGLPWIPENVELIYQAMTAAAPKLDIIEEFERECE